MNNGVQNDGNIGNIINRQALNIEALRAENEKLKKQLKEIKELFQTLDDNSWNLVCVNIPTEGGDYNIQWRVIEHYMSKPNERILSYGNTPIEAIELAIQKEGEKWK
jgi:hypothetical protein